MSQRPTAMMKKLRPRSLESVSALKISQKTSDVFEAYNI